MVRLYVFFVFLLLVCVPASAQFSSAIQGTITDPSTAAVPSAVVTVTNVATGIARQATTSAEGFYRVSNLGPGTYSVSVEKAGFTRVQQTAVDLAISAVVRVDLTLTVGAVSERIEVTGQVALLETEQGRVSGRIETAKIEQLPINGRNVLNLVALQPGVVGRGLSTGLYSGGGSDTFSGETQPAVFASGQRYESNYYSVDDTNTSSIARNGVTNLVPNSEAVEEVRVVANNFSAVDGRNPGAQIQMITKAGTNEFHGVAAYYYLSNSLAARTIFDPAVLPATRKHLFDFAGGGPVIRNRTFFFASYEGLRQGGSRTSSSVVETAAFRNFVVQTRPNSIAAYLLKNFAPLADPTSNLRDLGTPQPGVNKWSTTPDGILDVGTVFYTPASYRNANQFSIRVDHELRPGKDKIYASFFRTTNRTLAGGVRQKFDAPQTEVTRFGNINYIHIFSPNKINEFRAGIMQLIGLPDERKELQVPGVNISGSSGFSGALYPSGWRQPNWHYKDIFSWVRGTHTVKVGGELRHMVTSSNNTSNYIPTYSFNSILDFADDEAYTSQRLVYVPKGAPGTYFTGMVQTEWALFIQDDWKVTRTLTLNIGLRFENFGTTKDKQNTVRNFLVGAGDNMMQRIANGKVDYAPDFYPTYWKNFDPRFGFAWDPTGKAKWTVRGGYGIANDRMSSQPVNNYRGNPPLFAQANLGVPYGTSFIYSLGDPTKPYVGYPVDAALRVGLDSHNGISGIRSALQGADRNFRTPYVHNWFLGVQHELARKTIVELNYIGSAGHRLTNGVNWHRYPGDMLDGTFDGLNPSFASINMVQSTSNSIYHGATASVRHGFGSQITLQGSYTFGKAIGDTDQETGNTNWQNGWNRAAERGLLGFDTTHRFTLNGNWNMPFFKNRDQYKLAHYVLGGWELSGITILDNGNPFSITNSAAFRWNSTKTANIGGDYNADNNSGDRPNAPSTAVQSSGWTRQQFLTGVFLASAFPTPAPGTDGNLGRNTYRGPGYASTDLSLAKKFTIAERVTGLLRVDAYNAFNRVNLNSPNGDLNSSNFGKVTSQQSPRLFQVGLKLSF